MLQDPNLEQFLDAAGITWRILPRSEHWRLINEWESFYGRLVRAPQHGRFGPGGRADQARIKTQARAEAEYRAQRATHFFIVPFLGNSSFSPGEFDARVSACECRGNGTLPDLSGFPTRDFFVVPDDWSW